MIKCSSGNMGEAVSELDHSQIPTSVQPFNTLESRSMRVLNTHTPPYATIPLILALHVRLVFYTKAHLRNYYVEPARHFTPSQSYVEQTPEACCNFLLHVAPQANNVLWRSFGRPTGNTNLNNGRPREQLSIGQVYLASKPKICDTAFYPVIYSPHR